MDYYARVLDGLVVEVLVSSLDRLPDSGDGSTWTQTFFDGSQRYNYAGPGFTYDSTRDAFIPPTPFPSWVLDEDTCQWVAPIDYPADGGQYVWDEDTTDWIEVQDETP